MILSKIFGEFGGEITCVCKKWVGLKWAPECLCPEKGTNPTIPGAVVSVVFPDRIHGVQLLADDAGGQSHSISMNGHVWVQGLNDGNCGGTCAPKVSCRRQIFHFQKQ